jgi:hypothetical protein
MLSLLFNVHRSVSLSNGAAKMSTDHSASLEKILCSHLPGILKMFTPFDHRIYLIILKHYPENKLILSENSR